LKVQLSQMCHVAKLRRRTKCRENKVFPDFLWINNPSFYLPRRRWRWRDAHPDLQSTAWSNGMHAACDVNLGATDATADNCTL
ncbi:hypothetical protein J6590_104043, partial [Homalodisca vitripennis]